MDQPLVSNSVKTDEAEALGAMILYVSMLIRNRAFRFLAWGTYQRTIMMAKKPKTWMKVTIPSIRGSFRKSTVLAKIQRARTAQESMEVCQALGS